MTSSEVVEKRDILWDKEWKIKSWASDLTRNLDFAIEEGTRTAS